MAAQPQPVRRAAGTRGAVPFSRPEWILRRNDEEDDRGFSLIELLIVVAIILIIAAIAIQI
jgi:prepilin-type N-terminal cleavage/methylation domain-containing protein